MLNIFFFNIMFKKTATTYLISLQGEYNQICKRIFIVTLYRQAMSKTGNK